MFKWKKLGRIFNPMELKNESWMKEYAQAPSVLILEHCIRVFFSSRGNPENGQYVSRLGYIDLKKDDLFKIINICKAPILPLGELGTFDEFGTYPATVIKSGNETRVYYAGWTRCESVPFNAAIGLALSNDDGETFTRIGKGPVLSYSPDEPFVLGSPKIRRFNNTWYLWYSSGKKWALNNPKPEPFYKIRMARSADGVNWIKYGKDIIENVLDENECQAGADVFFFQGIYHMFFSYRYQLSKVYKVGYAFSNDLLNWERDDSIAGLGVSENGWDSESVSYPHVFELDHKIYMLYQGNEIGKYGFGLAELESYN
jgi:sucrose-6-phosphate hydrolase SacC (GH32 family)